MKGEGNNRYKMAALLFYLAMFAAIQLCFIHKTLVLNNTNMLAIAIFVSFVAAMAEVKAADECLNNNESKLYCCKKGVSEKLSKEHSGLNATDLQIRSDECTEFHLLSYLKELQDLGPKDYCYDGGICCLEELREDFEFSLAMPVRY